MIRRLVAALPAALFAVAALAADGSAADPASASAPGPPVERRPAFLTPVVNGVQGPAPILVTLAGQDALVRLEDLAAAGVAPIPVAAIESTPGGALVSLAALAPALRFEVDEIGLALRMQAGPELLGRRRVDLRDVALPPGTVTEGAPSAFLNYAAHGSTTGATNGTASGDAELGVTAGGWLALGAASIDGRGEVVRGLSSVSREWRDRLVRFTAGDLVVTGEPLGASPIVGGLTLERDLSMDPYLLSAPMPRVTAFASTPSTVEVWVNGALARTMPVAPGTYDLSNLPVTTGQSDVKVVVRDAFGRSETLDASRYQAQGLLAPGLHVWGWTAGATRAGFGARSFDYQTPVLLGHHRLGLTDALTLGARLEASPDLVSGGASLVVGVPLGAIQASGAASARSGEAGAAGLLAWRGANRLGALGVDAAWASPRYVTLSQLTPQPRWRVGGDAILALRRTMSARLASSLSDDGGERRATVDGSVSLHLSPRLFLQVGSTLTSIRGQRPDVAAFASLMFVGAQSTIAGVTTEARRSGASGTADVQRALPVGEGLGYRVRAQTSPASTDASALLQAQTAFGRYEAEYDRTGTQDSATASASGALVLVDGKLFAARPVTSSFALVEVPQVQGVRVRVNEQPAGRTDGDGDLLVPSLLPYYASRIRIEDRDVPLDRAVGSTERAVAPPRRGGARVAFEAPRLGAVHGRLHLAWTGGDGVPAYGTLAVEVEDAVRTSPISAEGEFWVERIPPGSHRAHVLWRGVDCAFALSVPADAPAVVEAGELGCTAATPPP